MPTMPFELRATSETEFFLQGAMGAVGVDIEFDVAGDGTVRGFAANTEYRPHRSEARALTRRASRPAAHTCAVFHFPRVNSHSVNRPTDVSEMNTPQNTPDCCQSRPIASSHDSGIWISQKNTRLIYVGVTVSPAPLNACTETIHQP